MDHQKKLINSLHKYYFIVLDKIFKADSDSTGKENLKKKLKNKKNISIIRLNFKKVSKKQIEMNNKSKLKLIGGNYFIEIKEFLYMDGKIKTIKPKPKNIVYISDKYFGTKTVSEFKKGMKKDLVKVSKKYLNNKFNNSLLAINKI